MSNTPNIQESMNDLRLKSDMVLLVDLITEHSHKVELVTYEDLMAEFKEKAEQAPVVSDEEIRNTIETLPASLMDKQVKGLADDGPEAKERRKVISRRMMFTNLFEGELKLQDLKEETPEETEEETREITPEYFDQVLQEVLNGDFQVHEFTSWDNKRYFHFVPLLSCSYARLMSAQNNPYELVVDTVRENSRIYPRPLGVYTFEYPPFNLSPAVIKDILDRLSEDENTQDIRVAVTSTNSPYLYSNKYLEDAYADFLAEEMDKGASEAL